MKLNEAGDLIKEEIIEFGEECTILTKDKDVTKTYVILESLLKKNKTQFEPHPSLVGATRNDFYVGIFPYDVDVRGYGIKDIIQIGDKKYYLIKADRICVGGQVIYYSAIIKRIQEGYNNA